MVEPAKKSKSDDFTAQSQILIDAPPSEVWDALTDKDKMSKVMFGSKVTTDWKVGGPITYSGEWEGKAFEDRGTILEMKKPRTLRMSHVAGADKSATEHEVTYGLAPEGSGTRVTLTQTNNGSADGQAKSEKNWEMMLKALKKVIED